MTNFDKFRKQIAEAVINNSQPSMAVTKDGNLVSATLPNEAIIDKDDREVTLKPLFETYVNFIIGEMRRDRAKVAFMIAVTSSNDETGEQEIVKLAGGDMSALQHLFNNLFK